MSNLVLKGRVIAVSDPYDVNYGTVKKKEIAFSLKRDDGTEVCLKVNDSYFDGQTGKKFDYIFICRFIYYHIICITIRK